MRTLRALTVLVLVLFTIALLRHLSETREPEVTP